MNILMRVCCIAAVVILSFSSSGYAAVSDNFSDLNDTVNPTWTRLSGYVASSGQAWDASTGQYRMTAPNNGASNFGFVGSYAGPTMLDAVVSADLVNFVDLGATPSGPMEGGVIGIAARLNGNNAVAGLTGYAYTYEPFARGGLGEMVMNKIGPGVAVTDLGDPAGTEGVDWIRKVTLDTNKDYRFTLSVIGSTLRGEVREIGGPIVAYQTNTDLSYASGFSGFVAYSQGPTTSNPQGLAPTDVTWDNFGSTPEPGTALLLASAIGLVLLRRGR
jgi:hypothetical protein